MKRLFVFLILIAIGCTSAKKENDGADSTKVSSDSAAVSQSPDLPKDVTPSEPTTIFPELVESALSDNPRETEVVQPLLAMLKQYDSDKYTALTGDYSFGYNEEIGPDEKEDVTESQTRTWYFDSVLNLKCYVKRYTFHGSNGGHPPSTKVIYLFSNDSLVAAYVDQVGVYESAKVSRRVVTAQCPKCGVVLTERRDSGVDTKSYYELAELDAAALAVLSDSFFNEYRAVVQWLKKRKRPEGDDPLSFTWEQGEGDKRYSEEFMTSTDLYKKLVATK